MLLNLQNSRNQNNWKTGANINIYIPKERAKRGEYNGYNAETTTTTAAAETVKIRSKDKDKIFKILQKYRRHYANNWRQIWRHRTNTIIPTESDVNSKHNHSNWISGGISGTTNAASLAAASASGQLATGGHDLDLFNNKDDILLDSELAAADRR